MRSKRHTHGMTGTKIHEVWKEMKRRCKGKYYGTRSYKEKGITVCKEWTESINFINWALSHGYREGLQIDRIDNNGNYCPENCRWVTPKENAQNRSNTVIIDYNGIKKPLQWWAAKLNINPSTLNTRLKRGWSNERALEQETQKRK